MNQQLSNLTGKQRAIIGLAAVAGALAIFASYKIHENLDTNGIGYRYADDLVFSDNIPVVEKKKQYFDFMRPIVEAENAKVLETRHEILKAREAGKNPRWLTDTAKIYGVEWTGDEWDQLLGRVDEVPLTLVLAQSANESSWGQSKFAQLGNNMFGQWCFTEGCGIVPARRDAGKNHEVAAFSSVNHSVRAYLENINSTRAYSKLRAIRSKARKSGRTASGTELAAGLLSYSERRGEYVEEIRAMIWVNKELMVSPG